MWSLAELVQGHRHRYHHPDRPDGLVQGNHSVANKVQTPLALIMPLAILPATQPPLQAVRVWTMMMGSSGLVLYSHNHKGRP